MSRNPLVIRSGISIRNDRNCPYGDLAQSQSLSHQVWDFNASRCKVMVQGEMTLSQSLSHQVWDFNGTSRRRLRLVRPPAVAIP